MRSEAASSFSRSRRDFLAWLTAVPLVTAGCAAEAHHEHHDEEPLPADPAQGSAAPTEEAEAYEQEARVCRHTTRDAEGPYFASGSPVRSLRIAGLDEPGVRLLVEGRLFGPDCRTPLEGYALDLWQADASGDYFDGRASGYRLRGKVVTDRLGRYRFETILPGRYGDAAGIRPAHIHAKVLTPRGGSLLTTQIYFEGDPHLGQADYCTRSRTCDSSDPARILRLFDATIAATAGKRARFDVFTPRT
ncbi:MAG: hypothetical protein KF819_10285 [Labilithrix sp.]|nr:hypothetical protein [Labilithrix sp.]